MDPPEMILQRLLGGNLTDKDVKKMMERPNGDLIIPYFYINPTGDSGSVDRQDDPYNVSIMPEFNTALISGGSLNELTIKMLITFNFSRNPKIPPIILTNQNIKVIFNNIYANLYKYNIKLVALVLNNTMDYPTVDYSQYNLPTPILTPKVTVNLETRVTSITVKMSLADILQKFKSSLDSLLTQYPSQQITLKNSDGSEQILVITKGTSGGTTDGTSGGTTDGTSGGKTSHNFLINNGSIQATSEIKVYRLNFSTTLFQLSPSINNADAYKLSDAEYSFGYSKNAIRFMFENSPKIPDSTIQNYFGSMLLLYKYSILNMFEEFGIPISFEQIVAINLENPSQEIKVDIGTETKSTSPSSILDEVRKLLCISKS
jgi:hypothetical protein